MTLKPCPFCESTNLEVQLGYVECIACGVEGPYVRRFAEGDEELTHGARTRIGIELWNSRATPEPHSEPQRAEVERA
jgi:hypothetical protein